MNSDTVSPTSRLAGLHGQLVRGFERIPISAIALLARFSVAAVFWKSGQTKVEGLAIDLVDGSFQWGWPRLTNSAVELFRDEYRVPLLPPELAAAAAALGEHVFPMLLILGLGTRLAALGLLGMTLVIQLFVYPDAYPTHGTWGALLLYLMATGPGKISLDAWIARRIPAPDPRRRELGRKDTLADTPHGS